MVHAERDHAWVHGYLLPELGLPEGAVLTPAGLTLGAPRAAVLERAVLGAGTVVLVLTPAFLDDVWAELAELLASSAQVMGRDGRLVPLVREPCQLPLRIDFLVSLDCTREERWPGAVARLREHLRRDQRPPEPEAIRCPYPGLVAFGQAQARVFFGRAGEVDDLHRRLPHQGLVMVIGPSGSGKTSLVFAGLLPRLEAADWAVRALRPGADPMAALAGALVDSDQGLSFNTDVAFSPDGRLLAVADGAPEVILWDLDEHSWRETLCSLVDRDFSDAERRRFFPGGQAEPTCGS